MAGRRKGPRKQRQQGSSQTLPRAASVAAAILALCLCAFNFDSNGENDERKVKKCRLCSVVAPPLLSWPGVAYDLQ